MPGALVPFHVDVPRAEVDDLRARLARTRWPEPATTPGWEQGVPLPWLQELCAYWADGYDWYATQTRLAALPQYRTRVDGLDLHLVHVRSPHPGALPLVVTHGWPGSFLELEDLVGPLTDPPAHGGRAEDAFDVVLPSLPGYGFSGRPDGPGWGVERTADAWDEVMARLGHDRYGAAGSDWGTSVSSLLGQRHPGRVAGIHLVPPLAGPVPGERPTPDEHAAQAALEARTRDGSAYSEVHATRPQTIGYGLVDSPVALCAWLAEKYVAWAEHPVPRDRLLDVVSLYWYTATGASSARLYRESIGLVSSWFRGGAVDPVDVPTGCSLFAAEVPHPSRRQVERRYPDVRLWREHDRGGHFPALEQPGLLVEDLRDFFRLVR